jgi:DNA-binding MarR family transcriptional regulator
MSKESELNKLTGAEALEAELGGRLGDAIKRAEQALTAVTTRALRDLNLTVPQYSVLLALSYLPGSSGAQLARICLVTPQTMTTVLGNLESKGLISREVSSVHQKVLVTTLTSAGRTMVKKADARVRDVEERLAEGFEPAERATLAESLRRAAKALHGE